MIGNALSRSRITVEQTPDVFDAVVRDANGHVERLSIHLDCRKVLLDDSVIGHSLPRAHVGSVSARKASTAANSCWGFSTYGTWPQSSSVVSQGAMACSRVAKRPSW